jgi:hypothetical protein
MTIAVSIKVNDGVVLAADSAATIMSRAPGGQAAVWNVYDNANKIFNLRKGSPIGAISWGSGSVGHASVSTLAKDFRRTITEGDEEQGIDPHNYTVEDVARRFKAFIFDGHYQKAFKDWKEKPALGFMVVGYSTGQPLAEEWKFDIRDGECKDPYRVRQADECGITWNGEVEAIFRIFVGHSTGLERVLSEEGLEGETVDRIMKACRERLVAPMVVPPMPIQDAINLAVFLVETTIGFSRFAPGAPTVGGPIEVAAITKHEGFRWVRRKHYFDRALNPP